MYATLGFHSWARSGWGLPWFFLCPSPCFGLFFPLLSCPHLRLGELPWEPGDPPGLDPSRLGSQLVCLLAELPDSPSQRSAPPLPGPCAQLWIGPFLCLQNDVEKVVVVILDKEHRPVEKFVFEIVQPPLLSIR